MPRSRIEDQLQSSIVDFHAVAVIDAASAILFAVPNGEKRDRVTAARLVGISAEDREQLPEADRLRPYGLGVLPGAVDLILLTAGPCTDLIELKRPAEIGAPLLLGQKRRRAGRQSPQQLRFGAAVRHLQHHHHVFSSQEEYADLLEARGIRLRFRPWGPGIAAPRAPAAFQSSS
jgi:hypothetical protein